VDALLAFGAAVLTLRLSGMLLGRWRAARRPELLAWGLALLAFALASGALAWGAAAGWNAATFRVYYLFGGMLTAALLGVGSLLLIGRRWAAPLGIAYVGFAAGLALAAPLTEPVGGTAIPEAGAHLRFLPVRLVAVLGNSLGTLAVVGVALATVRRRPLGNTLIVAGVLVAAVGSTLFGVGVIQTAASLALAAVLLYAGFVVRPRARREQLVGALRAPPDDEPEAEDGDDRKQLQHEPGAPSVGEKRHRRRS
jgi:hypothetical protein